MNRRSAIGERPHAAEPEGALADPQGVEVDVAGRVRLGPRVAGGEEAEARHDHDDRRRAVRRDVLGKALAQQVGHVVGVRRVGNVDHERPGPGVDDLVGCQRAAVQEGPPGRAVRERRREPGVVEGDHRERAAGGQEPAERRGDHVDQVAGTRRVHASRRRVQAFGGRARLARAGALQRGPDDGHEPRRSLVDLGRGIPADDDPVVLHDGDGRGRPAGALDVGAPGFDDGTRQRQPGIGVGHPHGLVAEEPGGEGGAVAVAGDRVEVDGVRVEHEALGQEGMEQQLHGGPSPARVGQARRHGRPHDRIDLGSGSLGSAAALAASSAWRSSSRGSMSSGTRSSAASVAEGHAARLDVQDAIDLHRRVAAAAARELGVASESSGHADELVERGDGRRRAAPGGGSACRSSGRHRRCRADELRAELGEPADARRAVGEAGVEPALAVDVARPARRPGGAGGPPPRRSPRGTPPARPGTAATRRRSAAPAGSAPGVLCSVPAVTMMPASRNAAT